MKKETVCILIENDGFLVKDKTSLKFNKFMPHNIDRIPNIPFYHSIWTYHQDGLIKPEIEELKEYIKAQYGKLSNVNGVIARPADVLPVDIRMIEETFQILGLPTCAYISKTSLLAINGIANYMALSTTERLVVLESYHNGKSVEKIFYNKSAVNRNKLYNDIGNIRYRHNDNNLEMYIFDGGNELIELYEIGNPINAAEMIEMLGDASKVLLSKKK